MLNIGNWSFTHLQICTLLVTENEPSRGLRRITGSFGVSEIGRFEIIHQNLHTSKPPKLQAAKATRALYGMLTLTRKKRLAELVGAHDLSVRFSLPSTVYTRSFFVPPSFKSGSQPTIGAPFSIEITARNTSVAFVGSRPAT